MPNGYKLSRIYLGNTKVRPDTPQEKIVYKMNADSSGNLYVPVAGYGTDGNQKAPYSWSVTVDEGAATVYSGTGYSRGSITISGYVAGTNHTIMIQPVTETYGRARAYGWYQVTSNTLVTEIVYDMTYKGFAASPTDTGDYFRRSQYYGCSLLTEIPEEYIPDTVKKIGERFRAAQYSNCTSLLRAAEEEMSSSITGTLGSYFRQSQYSDCTSLIYAPQEKLPSGVTYIGSYFRQAQYSRCSSLTYAPEEELPSTVASMSTYFRSQQYNYCTSLTEIKGWRDLFVGNSYYRQSQFGNSTSNKTVKILSDIGYASYDSNTLPNARVTEVRVPTACLSTFVGTGNEPRYSITDSKFVGY